MGWEQLLALCIYLTPPPFNSSVYPLEKKCMLLLLFYSQKPLLLVSLLGREHSGSMYIAFPAPATRGNHRAVWNASHVSTRMCDKSSCDRGQWMFSFHLSVKK